MYDSQPTIQSIFARRLALAAAVLLSLPSLASAQVIQNDTSLIRRISAPSEKLEITTNTSRILTLETRIPRVQVNNPELLSVTPLSATQIQVSAKKAGVTAVNLWDEEGNIHTVDVYIYGDVRELEHALKTQFPNSSVRVYRYSNSLVLTGFIDRPDYVTPIVELAQDYSPKIINNMNVGGVQQVLLKVKVFEVSRTKLRQLSTDWSYLSGTGGGVISSVADVISATAANNAMGVNLNGVDTFSWGIVNGGDRFDMFFRFLQENNVSKIMAEPNVVAVSGRPASFNEGGEIPILVPQSLGTSTIEFKPFGTQVDFLPIVLGNGRIRLEVRPRISDLDFGNAITLNGQQIPALKVREVDTAVELRAGQTFALAGLIQQRTQQIKRGVPWLSDIPFVGVPFRSTRNTTEEFELLVLVTPEFVDAMDPHQVPQCYPGSGTIVPDNRELYCGGQMEVPNPCGPCGQQPCVEAHGHEPCCPQTQIGCTRCGDGSCGSGYETGYLSEPPVMSMEMPEPTPGMPPAHPVELNPHYQPTTEPMPMTLPASPEQHGELVLPPPAHQGADEQGPEIPGYSQVRPSPQYSTARAPQYQRQASGPFNPHNPQPTPAQPSQSGELIGPVGYDLQ